MLDTAPAPWPYIPCVPGAGAAEKAMAQQLLQLIPAGQNAAKQTGKLISWEQNCLWPWVSTRNSPICEADKTILTSKAFLFPPCGAINSKKDHFTQAFFAAWTKHSKPNRTRQLNRADPSSPLLSLSTVESPAFGMPRMPVRWAEGSESPFAGNAKIKLSHPCALPGIWILPGLDNSSQAVNPHKNQYLDLPQLLRGR